jgi:hypothetical protein
MISVASASSLSRWAAWCSWTAMAAGDFFLAFRAGFYGLCHRGQPVQQLCRVTQFGGRLTVLLPTPISAAMALSDFSGFLAIASAARCPAGRYGAPQSQAASALTPQAEQQILAGVGLGC